MVIRVNKGVNKVTIVILDALMSMHIVSQVKGGESTPCIWRVMQRHPTHHRCAYTTVSCGCVSLGLKQFSHVQMREP